MIFYEGDVVIAKRQLSPGVPEGTPGTIVMVLGDYCAYFVDFTDINGDYAYEDMDLEVAPEDLILQCRMRKGGER